jgi:ABC-type nitrate/sulfonate/bicarbonate transport system permease component
MKGLNSQPLSMRLGPSLARLFRTTLGILAVILVWELLHRYVVNPLLLPSPLKVVVTLFELMRSGDLVADISASMRRILVGYTMGCAVGIILGLLMARSLWMNDLLSPLLEVLRPISPVAMLPLVLIWFGIDEFAKYFLVSYTAAIIVLLSTAHGVASMPIIRERAASCLGASERQIYLHVILPSAVPHIITGMRTALGFSFMAIVAAELIAAENGIGYLIMQSRMLIQVDQTFAGLLTLSALGALSDLVFRMTLSRLGRRYQQEIYNV